MLRSLTSTPQHLLRAPPQLGVGPPAQYFSEQKQDHLDPSSSRTWSQAFFVNDTFWRPGSDAPIFLCVGLSSHVRPGASVRCVPASCVPYVPEAKGSAEELSWKGVPTEGPGGLVNETNPCSAAICYAALDAH